MSKKTAPGNKRSGTAKKSSGSPAQKDLTVRDADRVKGGKPDGSLDAGLHFKYDIKGNKEG